MKRSITSSNQTNTYLPEFPAEITISVTQGFDIIKQGNIYKANSDNYMEDMNDYSTDSEGLYLYDQDGILYQERENVVDENDILEDSWVMMLDWLEENITPEVAQNLGTGYHSVSCDITLVYLIEDVCYVTWSEYPGDESGDYFFDNMSVKFSPKLSHIDNAVIN